MEGQVGYFRCNYLTLVPRVVTLEDLNQQIAGFEERELSRWIGSRIRTIGQDFEREAPHLLPLPPEAFETAMTFEPRVDRYSRITVKMCSYSVSVRFIDRKVIVHLTGDTLVVLEGRRTIARHARLAGRGLEHLVLDHYLEVLLREPGALDRSEALHQARAEGTFTAEHEAFWAMAQQQLGEIEGTEALVRVLLLHRHQQHADVLAGLRAAVELGTCNDDVVALEARKAAQTAGRAPTVTAVSAPPDQTEPQLPQASHITPRRLARPLPEDARPLPPGAVGRTAPSAPEGITMTAAHHALTAQASDAAIDTACRLLRLPTMRAQAADTIARAEREGLSYAGFLAELLFI
ncbi:MAG TPA: hypothetical protein VIU15_41655 [Streptomyces sp.]